MHPVQYEAAYPERQNRLTVFFRLILAIPLVIVAAFWGIAVLFVTIAAWFAILFTGRYPEGMWQLSSGFLRYAGRAYGYLYLQADPWPPIAADAPGYPLQVSIVRPASQSRLTVFFRIILVIPAAIVAGVLDYVLRLLSVLVWLITVIMGRQPAALHSFMGTCIRFYLRTEAYGLLLVDAYPNFSSSSQAHEGGVPVTTP